MPTGLGDEQLWLSATNDNTGTSTAFNDLSASSRANNGTSGSGTLVVADDTSEGGSYALSLNELQPDRGTICLHCKPTVDTSGGLSGSRQMLLVRPCPSLRREPVGRHRREGCLCLCCCVGKLDSITGLEEQL